ncbi:MAG: pilus assembly protein [Planctomycetes bacterium]|nr:pilus assembly protein [Planctomycetota bacterium]
MRMRPKETSPRRGATTVEFAICLPILFSVLFGLLEFSRVTQLQQAARLAAFEGARSGIPLNATTADVQASVNKVMSAVSISSFTTTITPGMLAYTSPTVSVTVTLSPNANAWFKWYVSDSSSITANVTLAREVQAVSVP